MRQPVSNYKKCLQCGCILPLDSFKIKRTRADGTKARSRYCRECEVDTRNYLALIDQQETTGLMPMQERELAKLNQVFAMLEKQGLSTPLSRTPAVQPTNKPNHLDALMEHYGNDANAYQQKTPATVVQLPSNVTPKAISTISEASAIVCSMAGIECTQGTVNTITEPEIPADTPADLKMWLETPFETWREQSLTPEYLNEIVYPTLKAQYRPETGWDAVKLVQTYDDTYKQVLNQISQRFWDYEDWFIAEKNKNTTDKTEE